jgi:hypothetical protein
MFDFKNNFKDALSNLVAVVLVIFSSVSVYLQSLNGAEINWFQIVMTIGGAIVAWLTGKSSTGATKPIVKQ